VGQELLAHALYLGCTVGEIRRGEIRSALGHMRSGKGLGIASLVADLLDG